jgi:hypothetical protein
MRMKRAAAKSSMPELRHSARPTQTGKFSSERIWCAAAVSSVLVLLWTCRHAPLGVPAADNYYFINWLKFHKPLSLWDTMGIGWYWRPITRQLYYTIFESTLFAHPWVSAAINVVVFGMLVGVLYRISRFWLSPPLAAFAAAFPALAELARPMLSCIAGADYSIAMLFALLAIHEALYDRPITMVLASLASLLCHESSLLALAPVMVFPALKTGRWQSALRWAGMLLVAALLWQGLYHFAWKNGVAFPTRPAAEWNFLARSPGILAEGLVAELNLEDLSPFRQSLWLVGFALVFAGGWLWARRRGAPRLSGREKWLVLGVAAYFVAGMVPLAAFSNYWLSMRAFVPGIWLGLGVAVLLGPGATEAAGALLGLRVVTLLLVPVASLTVSDLPPVTHNQFGFLQIARLQRLLEETRRTLKAAHPTLPPGTTVYYWGRPALTEVGFAGPRALRSWYADSTLNMEWYGLHGAPTAWVEPGQLTGGGIPGRRVVLAFNPDTTSPVVVISPQAQALFESGAQAWGRGDLFAADSLFLAASLAQPGRADEFFDALARRRARIALLHTNYALADSLNQVHRTLGGDTADFSLMDAILAIRQGDLERAERSIEHCLKLAPRNAEALRIQRSLRGS